MNLPSIGQTISWFGTVYTVLAIRQIAVNRKSAIVIVQHNPLVQLPLWWTDCAGCKIIK